MLLVCCFDTWHAFSFRLMISLEYWAPFISRGILYWQKYSASNGTIGKYIVSELVYLYTCSIFHFRNFMLMTNYTCFRGMSSAHAIFITAVSLYIVTSTDLFSDCVKGPITFRNSIISTSALGVLNHLLWYINISFNLYMMYLRFIFELNIVVSWMYCLTGFCWLLHHWSWNDLLAVSFPWWNGICRCQLKLISQEPIIIS
jgi:hypothetical protein